MIVSCNVSFISSVVGAKLLEGILSKPRLPRVAALKIHLVYICQEGSREQVILFVRLALALPGILA